MVTKPLIVKDEEGRLLDAVLVNQKAYNKSTEHGRLWCVHPDTGRVLPYRGNIEFQSLEDSEELCRAAVTAKAWASSPGSGGPGVETNLPAGRQKQPSGDDGNWADVISGLIEIIRDRKENLPEGSYTSYLFNSGEAKIRKKTGEEAVELILAATREETTSEAADLIYHLLVLLEVEEIPLRDIAEELRRR